MFLYRIPNAKLYLFAIYIFLTFPKAIFVWNIRDIFLVKACYCTFFLLHLKYVDWKKGEWRHSVNLNMLYIYNRHGL